MKARIKNGRAPQEDSTSTIWVFRFLFLCLPLSVAPGLFVGRDVTPKWLILGIASCWALIVVPKWWNGATDLWLDRYGKAYCWLFGLSSLSIVASTMFSDHFQLSLAGTTWRRYGAFTQLCVLFISLACASYCRGRPERIRQVLLPVV